MKGENKAFMGGSTYNGNDTPMRYLQKNVLSIDSVYDVLNLPEETWEGDFDIIENQYLLGRKGQKTTVFDANDRKTDGKYCVLGRLQDRNQRKRPAASGGFKSSNGIPAYYLGWNTSMVFTGIIGKEHRLFFTPSLTGCTFVAAGNSLQLMTVAHLNCKKIDKNVIATCRAMGREEEFFENQINIETYIKQQGWNRLRYFYALFPKDYEKSVPIKLTAPDMIAPEWAAKLGKKSEVASVITVIGCRAMHGWKFYYQVAVTPRSGKYQILRVAEVPRINL